VSIAAIGRGWVELLRLAASIRTGRVSATLALQRFGSAAQGDPLPRAAEHLRRLLRTVFLCDDIAIEGFRRENHTLLNRGEPAYQLQRAVDSGKQAPDRGRRRDEMKAMSGSQALLTNMVLAWNTRRMHEVIERLKRDGMRIEDDWLRRIGPAHFSDINFLGAMRFGGEICRGFGTARAAPSWHVWLRDKANRIRPRTDVDNSCQTTRVDAMSRQTMSFALPESVRE